MDASCLDYALTEAEGREFEENGFVVVLKNEGSHLEILARNDMGDAILANPAISDGRIFIRTRSQLICVAN